MTVLFQAILRIACLSALSRRATLALTLASIALGTALLLASNASAPTRAGVSSRPYPA